MFLYYLINFWKEKQNWLKKILSHVAGMAHLRVFIWKILISSRWDLGKIKWDLTQAGWLASHMNVLYFNKSFFEEGEISLRPASPPNRSSSPPYKQPFNAPAFDFRDLEFIYLFWYSDIFSQLNFRLDCCMLEISGSLESFQRKYLTKPRHCS